MKRFLQILVIIFISSHSNTYGKHITGGKFRYTYLGGTEFKIQLELERDCASGGASFDNLPRIGLFAKSDNRLISEYSLFNDSIITINNNPYDCEQAKKRCYEIGYFSVKINTKNFQLINNFFDSLGYYLNWERCCLNDEIINILYPESTPFGAILEIPKLTLINTNNSAFVNSSPYLPKAFNPVICLNQDLNYNFSFVDPDGDSLVYELIRPYAGGYTSANNPMQRFGPKPYDEVYWEIGFDDTTIVPANPKLKIDSRTGLLTMRPKELGRYLFSLAVHEYRNKKLLGTVIYESMILVYNCESAIIEQPTDKYAHSNSVVTFHVKHTAPNVTYQWEELKNSISKILVGETNDTLQLQNVSSDMHNNQYRCIIKSTKLCTDTSNYATLQISGVGIEKEIHQDLILYPNPSQSLVYFSDQSPKNIKLLSSDGRLLIQKNNTNQIDISDLTNGVYIIKLESLDGKLSWVKQIIKQ